VDNDAVLLLQVIYNKKVFHFSSSLLETLQPVHCSVYQFHIMLHFKKISSDSSLSDIHACPIWTKNQTTMTKYSFHWCTRCWHDKRMQKIWYYFIICGLIVLPGH